MNVYFLMNGNIYNESLPKKDYSWTYLTSEVHVKALLPQPPYIYIAQSYENAYETAFLAEHHYALNKYPSITYPSSDFPTSFINGTFGYQEEYKKRKIDKPLVEKITYYLGQPYIFISAGSGGSVGYMYLNWVIGTFGIPYEITIP
ncbi:MAG: hypothetical protein ACP5GI_06965 [Sulfolobales archaeon]